MMTLRRGIFTVLCLGSSFIVLTCCTTIALVGGGAATVGSLAMRDKTLGETATDSLISAKILKKLYSISPDVQAKVGVNVQEGEVLLTGTLPTEDERIAVESAVWSIEKVKRVYNKIELTDQDSMKSYPQDAWITSRIKASLLADWKIRSVNYSIKTIRGVVYIFGIARTKKELQRVTKVASRVRGVERVMSYIRLKPSKENNQL